MADREHTPGYRSSQDGPLRSRLPRNVPEPPLAEEEEQIGWTFRSSSLERHRPRDFRVRDRQQNPATISLPSSPPLSGSQESLDPAAASQEPSGLPFPPSGSLLRNLFTRPLRGPPRPGSRPMRMSGLRYSPWTPGSAPWYDRIIARGASNLPVSMERKETSTINTSGTLNTSVLGSALYRSPTVPDLLATLDRVHGTRFSVFANDFDELSTISAINEEIGDDMLLLMGMTQTEIQLLRVAVTGWQLGAGHLSAPQR